MKEQNDRYEDLLFDLPDYISGKMTDMERISEIENKINTNPEFKAEYENLNQTFLTLSKISFNEPSDAFFNNMLPKIHQKLSEPEFNPGKSIWQRFFPTLKYILPAMSIVLIIFLYNFNNPSIVNETDSIFNNNSNEIIQNSEIVDTKNNQDNKLENLITDSGDKITKLAIQNSSNSADVKVVNSVEIMPGGMSLFFNEEEIDEDLSGFQIDNLSQEDEEAIISVLNQEL